VATSKDGENGYRSAAEDVDSGELKEMFNSHMAQRAQFAEELLKEVHRLDVASERKGTVAALIHRGWMNMKAALTRRDVSAVIHECARGEHAAIKDYEAVLNQDLPPEIRSILEKQYAELKKAHERVSGLKVIAVLKPLIAACKDSENGYRAAKEHVADKKLKDVFEAEARQRGQFANELQAEVRRLGDPSEKKGTFAGAVHRGWIGLKSAFKGDARAVLAECERGERSTVTRYEEALAQEMPAEVRALVEKQLAKIKEAETRNSTLQGELVKT
jgi:uncharacterized protein (TIGR02284 family)